MYTTPVAIGGAVFVTTFYSGEQLCVFAFFCEDPEYVTALSAKDGSTYWTQRMDLAADLWATT
jgi:hypothetical protein